MANITAIVAFVGGGIAALLAGKRYFREKKHERVVHLYSLANSLFRAELTAQHRANKSLPVDPTPIADARAAMKNWYYDNRFLFTDDTGLKELIEDADDEAQSFLNSLRMDRLVVLRNHLELQLGRAP